jgi:hypothetical protein
MIEGAGSDARAERPKEDNTPLNRPQADLEGMTQKDVDQMLMPTQAPSLGQGAVFERPEPLTLAKLHAIKRAVLFG